MSQHYISFSSITFAHKAKSYLLKHGIKTNIVKTPRSLGSCGCGYSLKTMEDIDKVAALLGQAGIPIVSIS